MELLIMLDQLTHPDARAFFSAPDPAAVLVDLHRTGQLPEVLTRLAGIPQPADSHPEGDVWTHTLLVVEQAAMLAREHRLSESQRFLLLLACLVHDLGKMDTTVVGPDGRIRSWKHEQPEIFLPLYHRLGTAWNLSDTLEQPVQALVSLHLPNAVMQKVPPTEREARQFLKKLDAAQVPFLMARLLIAADQSGRRRGRHDPLAAWEPLVERLRQASTPPRERPALITGEDLIALGISPGPRFRELLSKAREFETAGHARDEILTHLRASAGRGRDGC